VLVTSKRAVLSAQTPSTKQANASRSAFALIGPSIVVVRCAHTPEQAKRKAASKAKSIGHAGDMSAAGKLGQH
jgi:hypothetical protein